MLEQSRAQIFGSQLGGPFLGRIFLPGRPHLGNASCQLALGKEQQSRMGVSRAYELFSRMHCAFKVWLYFDPRGSRKLELK
jgi:hypothetical protein